MAGTLTIEVPRKAAADVRGAGRVSTAEPRVPGKTWTLADPELPRVLKGMVWKLCYPSFTSEDRQEVFQETLKRLVEKGDLPDGTRRDFCSKFLHNTGHNVVREHWRKVVGPRQNEVPLEVPKAKGHSPEAPSESNPWRVAPSIFADPFKAMTGMEIRKSVRGCLKRLHRTRRRPVFLKMLGFKTPEIARRLGESPKSAENRALRGMKQLRQCLENQGVTP